MYKLWINIIFYFILNIYILYRIPGETDEGGYLRVFLNDIILGTATTKGITIYVLDNDTFSLISQTTYNVSDDVSQVSTMISDINALIVG